jgi:hypothetical protein
MRLASRLRMVQRAVVLIVCLASLAPAPAVAQELPAPQAWEALDRGDASRAAALFREALERSPRNALLHFGSAQASLELDRVDAATASLKRAIEFDPNFLQAMVLLAQVAYITADLDLAIRSLEQAARVAPRDRHIAAQLAEWRNEATLHRSFQTQSSTRFNVLFEGPAEKAIADQISATLEAAYWRIGEALNIYPAATLDVILYSTKQFRDITRAPAWAGGGYDGRIRLPVANALRKPEALQRVVTHEYVHAVVGHAAGFKVPAWVNEGLASYFEADDRRWAKRALNASSDRIPLEDLETGFGGLDGETAVLAYAESLIAAELLVELVRPHVGPFLQLIGNGHTVDQALARHGIEPGAFHAEWRRRVGLRDSAR